MNFKVDRPLTRNDIVFLKNTAISFHFVDVNPGLYSDLTMKDLNIDIKLLTEFDRVVFTSVSSSEELELKFNFGKSLKKISLDASL